MSHVVIIGAGFAGLELAKNLSHSHCTVTLIEQNNYHLFQPLLYQVAGAQLAPNDIALPIRELLKKNSHIRVVMDRVEGVDTKQKKLQLLEHGVLTYDKLVIAVGNQPRLPTNPQWLEHVITLKGLTDSLMIRQAVLQAYEEAEWSSQAPHFVVVGGGATGVEMAGTLAEMAKITLKNNFRSIQSEHTKITLIELSPRILGPFDESLSDYAVKSLNQLGVKVVTKAIIKDIRKNELELDSEVLQTNAVIWAAGTQAVALTSTLGLTLSPDGRIPVDEFLAVKGVDDVYALGDCAAFTQKGAFLPALAPVAKQQGSYLSKNIFKVTRKPFYYWDKGSLAVIGKNKAIGKAFGKNFKGYSAWLVWAFIHIFYLIGFSTKLLILSKWIGSYFTGSRGSRLIHGPSAIHKRDKF